MIITGKPNLIFLDNGVLIDGFLDGEDWTFEKLGKRNEEDIQGEVGAAIKFNRYSWYGLSHEAPWPIQDSPPFNPLEVSVIVPMTENVLSIRGAGRRIILTKPFDYYEKVPNYALFLTDESQVQHIRVLEPVLGKPAFHGLREALTPEGFARLPRVGQGQDKSLIFYKEDEILVPESSMDYF